MKIFTTWFDLPSFLIALWMLGAALVGNFVGPEKPFEGLAYKLPVDAFFLLLSMLFFRLSLVEGRRQKERRERRRRNAETLS